MTTILRTNLLLIFLGLFLLSSQAWGQELNIQSDTITWNASALKDLGTDTTLVNTSEFITYRSEKIVWKQQTISEQQVVMNYSVDSTSGNWTVDGYVEYYCTRNGKSRTFRFEKHTDNNRVIVSYTHEGQARTLQFTISQTTKLED